MLKILDTFEKVTAYRYFAQQMTPLPLPHGEYRLSPSIHRQYITATVLRSTFPNYYVSRYPFKFSASLHDEYFTSCEKAKAETPIWNSVIPKT